MTLADFAVSEGPGVGYVTGSKNALYDGPPSPSLDSTGSEARRTDLMNNPRLARVQRIGDPSYGSMASRSRGRSPSEM